MEYNKDKKDVVLTEAKRKALDAVYIPKDITQSYSVQRSSSGDKIILAKKSSKR